MAGRKYGGLGLSDFRFEQIIIEEQIMLFVVIGIIACIAALLVHISIGLVRLNKKVASCQDLLLANRFLPSQ